MASTFLEIVVKASDITASVPSRDAIEESLNAALTEAQLGEVTGGGAGSDVVILDVEIWQEEHFHDALSLMRHVLRELKVPSSTLINRYKPKKISYGLTD